jgi:hypothetical protein
VVRLNRPGVFEVPDARGLAGKGRLRLTSNETLEHGLVHLRYAVEPTSPRGQRSAQLHFCAKNKTHQSAGSPALK